MRTLSRLALGAVVLAAFAAESRADSVWLSRRDRQTRAGQNFDWTFHHIPQADGGHDGWFTIYARGDYSGSHESILWNVDSLMSGRAGPGNGASVLHRHNRNDVFWKQSYRIPGSTMAQMTADRRLNVWLDLNHHVNIINCRSFVKGMFDYKEAPSDTVPEPASLALLGMGGLFVWRRKRKSK